MLLKCSMKIAHIFFEGEGVAQLLFGGVAQVFLEGVAQMFYENCSYDVL